MYIIYILYYNIIYNNNNNNNNNINNILKKDNIVFKLILFKIILSWPKANTRLTKLEGGCGGDRKNKYNSEYTSGYTSREYFRVIYGKYTQNILCLEIGFSIGFLSPWQLLTPLLPLYYYDINPYIGARYNERSRENKRWSNERIFG